MSGLGESSHPRFAVVLKAYFWDGFVERQARRCEAQAAPGDFFLLLDETNGPLPSVPFRRVLRTSNWALIRRGFANRFGEGSLLWWNADYPHYLFHETYPEYDFYIFLEYDASFRGSFAELAQRCAAVSADLVVHDLQFPKERWAWTKEHLPIYCLEELEGCLMSISVQSARALALLGARRREMRDQAGVTFWPLAEAFLSTEARRAGLHCVPLASFGSAEACRWRPPLLEAEVGVNGPMAFFHPVYDESRFVTWALAQGAMLRDFVDPHGPVLQHLRRLPAQAYLPALSAALTRSIFQSIRLRSAGVLQQAAARVQNAFMARQL